MDADVLQNRAFLVPLYDQFHVDLDLAGHDHDYERSKPLTGPAAHPTIHASTTDGTTYVICAGAGADAYGAGKSSFTATSHAFGDDGGFGTYGLLSVDPTTLTLVAHELRGDGSDPVIDTFTATEVPTEGDAEALRANERGHEVTRLARSYPPRSSLFTETRMLSSKMTGLAEEQLMTTRIATALADGSADRAVSSLIADAKRTLGSATPSLVVAFASTAQPLASVMAPLAEAFRDAVLVGASTAGEFTERGDAKHSTSLFAVAGDYKVFAGMGTGLKRSPERAVEQALQGLPREVSGYPHRTAILLLDPLAGNGEEATLIASSMLGADVRLAGGAAGDDL